MTDRLAVLGLFGIAVLAWVLPAAARLGQWFLRPKATVIYAIPTGEAERLVWSPRAARENASALQGRRLTRAGLPGDPVGGWQGLLLGNALDLNRAGLEDLEALPGVGPKTAFAILKHRESSGPFRTVDELVRVPGIGPKTLERLRPWVRATLEEP